MSNRGRREFLRAAASSMVGATLGAIPVAALRGESNASRLCEFSGVRLAIATICCDGFGDENFRPAFGLLPKIGFQYVEFNCWYPRTLTPAGLQSISRRCKEIGVTPICVQGNGFTDHSAADVSHKLWCMQAARQLGCRRVKFTGSKRGTRGGLKAVIATLKQLAPAAEEMDVIVCVENHANNNIENIQDYDQIFAAVDSRHVGMCLDTGHFDGADVSIPDVVERFHDRVVHVDLKDCQSRGTYKTVRFGEGITDNHGTVKSLVENGYNGYLVVEQAPPIAAETLEADLRRAYEMFAGYEHD